MLLFLEVGQDYPFTLSGNIPPTSCGLRPFWCWRPRNGGKQLSQFQPHHYRFSLRDPCLIPVASVSVWRSVPSCSIGSSSHPSRTETPATSSSEQGLRSSSAPCLRKLQRCAGELGVCLRRGIRRRLDLMFGNVPARRSVTPASWFLDVVWFHQGDRY